MRDEKDLIFQIAARVSAGVPVPTGRAMQISDAEAKSFSSLILHPSSFPAPWLYCDRALAAERAVCRVVGWNIQGEQRGPWCAHIDGPAAAVND